MKRMEHFVPFIDIIFQALGALIVAMTAMQQVESIPVDFATVGKDVKIVRKIGEKVFIAISRKGLFSGKKRVEPDMLEGIVRGKEVVLRVDREIPYGRVIEALAGMRDKAEHVALEVRKNE